MFRVFYQFAKYRLLLLVILLFICMINANAGGLFEDKIIDRENKGHRYYGHIISNIPQCEVMRLVGRHVLNKVYKDTQQVLYHALVDVGQYGKKKKDLLPYDYDQYHQTIVVIDRSTITNDELKRLDLLQTNIYRLMPPLTTTGSVRIWVQNMGRSGNEYQVFVDIPQLRWLEKATNDLWAIPSNAIPEKSKLTVDLQKPLSTGAILTNDAVVKDQLLAAFPYCDFEVSGIEDFDRFRDAKNVTKKFIAINWNGDVELSSIVATQIFPPALKSTCSLLKPDASGFTEWQRFCRKAKAVSESDNDVETWVISAPTTRHLRAITDVAIKNDFAGKSYDLNIADLSHIQNLAVGSYIASNEVERDRLILQQQMEELVLGQLKLQVKSMVTSQDWGKIIDEVIDRNTLNDNPFARPDDIRRINQASKADAILLLWVKSLTPEVSYSFPCERLTPPFPPFTEKEPSKPVKPDPNERQYGVAGPHLYPGETTQERIASDKYQNSLRIYTYERSPEYDKKMREYLEKKAEWEHQRDKYRVSYQYEVMVNPKVAMTGYLKIVNIIGAQQLLWSTEVSLEKDGDAVSLTRIPVVVYGEGTTPSLPPEAEDYVNSHDWQGCIRAINADTIYSLGQDVLLSSLSTTIRELPQIALWSTDLKPWNTAKKIDHPNDLSANNEDIIIEPPSKNDPPIVKPDVDIVDPPKQNPSLKVCSAKNLNGTVMFPLNDIALWLGANKSYNAKTNTVIFTLGERIIATKIGTKSASINGNGITMEAPFTTILDVGYVPMSFIELAFSIKFNANNDHSEYTMKHPTKNESFLLRIQ